MSHTDFEIAGGGVIGRDHRTAFHNYQDAYLIHEQVNCTIAIVADGCSSGSGPDQSHNEVGARIGSLLLATALERQLFFHTLRLKDIPSEINWKLTLEEVTAELAILVGKLGPGFRKIIQDYFLFTIVGAVLTDETAYFFTLGDGIIYVNGKPYEPGPYNNMPPYLAYRITDAKGFTPADLELTIHEQLPIDAVDTFLLGCDGVADLHHAVGRKMPGLEKTVPGLDAFWDNDRYYNGNPDLLSRQLRLISRDWPKKDPEAGLLPDDTTMIIGRRKRNFQDRVEEVRHAHENMDDLNWSEDES